MADDIPLYSVVDMPRASLLQDGSRVQMEFRAADGKRVCLEFEPDHLEIFTARAYDLVAGARNQRLAIGDHFVVHPLGVAAAGANAPIGGHGKVILFLRTDNGVVHHFAMSYEESAKLRPQLRTAEVSAEKQTRQMRQ